MREREREREKQTLIFFQINI